MWWRTAKRTAMRVREQATLAAPSRITSGTARRFGSATPDAYAPICVEKIRYKIDWI